MNNKDFFINNLLSWAKDNLLDYPWRHFNDPYKSLITEIMLRKTNAEKVRNIIQETLEIIPTLEHLEGIPEDILELILEPYGMSKLKAQQLKLLASQIREKHNGKVPDSEADLLSLSGVGKYICNAMRCFAFNKRVGIVDTNVIRLISRYFGYQSNKKRPRDDMELWQLVEDLVPEINFREFNYALLDFPKKNCKAKKPNCDSCELLTYCFYNSNK